MKNMRVVLAGILCAAAAGASAQSFERQVSQISRSAAVLGQPNRQIFLATGAQMAAVQSPAAWVKVTGPDGTFTAEMPETPTYTKPEAGAVPATHTYYLKTATAEFIAASTDLPPEADTSNTRPLLEGGANGSAQGLDNGKWISITWTKHQGLLAYDAIGLYHGKEFRSYGVIRGHQFINLGFAVLHDGSTRSDDANRFFESLNIR